MPDPAHASASLVLGADGAFYGAAQDGGAYNLGSLFKADSNGVISLLYSFTNGPDGSHPAATLLRGADEFLYGLTSAGLNGQGNVFKLSTNGAFNNFYTFANNGDGGIPEGPLVQGIDGNLFSASRFYNLRGVSLPGSIFQLTTNGSVGTMYILNPLTHDGAYPAAGVIEASNGNIYGTSEFGGTSGNGAVFRVTRGGAYTTMVDLDGFNAGSHPQAPLVEGPDGSLYGTTTSGGPGGKGTIFRLSMTGAPQILTQPGNLTLLGGSSLNFAVGVSGSPTMFYRWQKNGTNLSDAGNLSGSFNRLLTLTNISTADAGSYAVTITNSSGSVTSAPAVLKVVFPPQVQTITKTNGGFVLRTVTIPGQRYRLQFNNSLTSSVWTSLGVTTTAVTNTITFTDATASGTQRFYRVVMLP